MNNMWSVDTYHGGSKPPPYIHNVRASGHITPCTARNITHNNVVHITYALAYISRMRSIPYHVCVSIHITTASAFPLDKSECAVIQ